MQVSVIETTELERRMTVQIPADVVEKEVKLRLASLTQRVKMDGFRPGKIPLNVVEKKYGNQVRSEVKQEVVEKTFRDVVKQQKLRPAGSPLIESTKDDLGKDLEFTAVFEVYPEFEVKIPDDLIIEQLTIEITEDNVSHMVEKLRKQQVEFNIVSRGARYEDRLIIDFLGTIDGQPFSGGEAKQFSLILGSRTLIAGFEEKLLDIEAGQTREFDCIFPVDYYIKELANRLAHFVVTVHTVMEPRLPELNDEFYTAFDVREGGKEGFLNEVRKNMEREAEQTIKNKTKKKIFDALLEANPVQAPRSLIENEIQIQMQQFSQQLVARGMKEADIKLDPANFALESKNRVQLGLILTEIVKANNLKISSQEIRNHIEAIAATYDDSNEVVSWYYQEKERLAGVEAFLLEDKVVNLLLSQAQLKYHPINFEDLMKPSS